MRTSEAGLNLIKKSEGLRLVAYPDPATHGEPYTIGYGHTSAAGLPNVKPGMKISNKEADAILKDDLRKFEDAIVKVLKRAPTQAQFDAMVSLCFNIGPGNFTKSTVLRKFNEGDFAGAGEAFMLFIKANGKTMQGLVNRRNEERKLFLTGSTIKLDEPETTAKADPEPMMMVSKPVLHHRKVWASIMGWLGGGSVASFAAFSGFDWRSLLVLVAAISAFVLFFWFMYRREIERGMFSK